jgi:general secretion pathway protein A
MILHDLGLKDSYRDKTTLIKNLNQFLLEQTSQHNNVAVIIDEAQNLKVSQFRANSLYSQIWKRKRINITNCLSRAAELDEKLKLPQLRQLNQRISVRFHILPCKEKSLKPISNTVYELPAQRKNIWLIFALQIKLLTEFYNYSSGTPRMINVLCDRALLAGYVLVNRPLTKTLLKTCARRF